MLNKKSVLITGGAGSFGKTFVGTVLKRYPEVKRLVVFSRDELKHHKMAQMFPRERYPAIRYVIGDVRDERRLRRALEGIEIVVHAAALKHVPAAEHNPFECVKTNVLGAQNLIEASLDTKIERLVALSTDKAAAPINLYGATKFLSEKLLIAANSPQGSRRIRISVVRYGNVLGSSGSVVPLFLAHKEAGVLPITDPRMTRFNISIQDGVDMVLWSIENAEGGEVLVPKLPSYRICDLATAISPHARQDIIGIRPGEKIHEQMITMSESFNTVNLGKYYAILPVCGTYTVEEYCARHGAVPVEPGFAYDSGTNHDFLTVEQLRMLIAEQGFS